MVKQYKNPLALKLDFVLRKTFKFQKVGALLSSFLISICYCHSSQVLFSGSGYPDPDLAGLDILIRMEDFDKDGISEFVCTSFFSVGVSHPDAGKVTLYGAPDR
jgi:hypothetical protein